MVSTQPKANGKQTATKRINGKHPTKRKRPVTYHQTTQQTACTRQRMNNNEKTHTTNQKQTASKRPPNFQANGRLQTVTTRATNGKHTTKSKRPANGHKTNKWQAHNQAHTASKLPPNSPANGSQTAT
jgi:hypothetical protein